MTTTTFQTPDTTQPSKRPNAFIRLYRGETSFDFVGRRRWWYLLSAVIIIAGLVSLGTRGFNLGIDFKGGTSWEIQASGISVSEATKAVQAAGVPQPIVESLGTGKNTFIEVQADLSKLTTAQQSKIEAQVSSALGTLAHESSNKVSITTVGPTWGSQITKKAIEAVIIFFIAVVIYISFRFEWKMALAAIIAVLHDLLVTAGVYSLFGFQVTPDTVIAILTILGYSLYDTVVVFDRVRDSTRGLGASGRMTYQDVVNLSMNQVLARSINTSLVAILPVLSILVIGAQILGASTLQYFGLALVIGLISGAYSSIFIASPILSQLKEREPRYINIRQKLANRDTRAVLLTPAAAAAMMGASDTSGRRTVRPAAKK
ncbi:MAG: protein translocase subunit SecF, partial [Acidimicrobiales bacterium]